MQSDELFSKEVAAEIFADRPEARGPSGSACRFCGQHKPDVLERCLQVTTQELHGILITRSWLNFSVLCCRACYRRGVTLNVVRLIAVGWVWVWLLVCPVLFFGVIGVDSTPLTTVAAVVGIIAGFVGPIYLLRYYTRWRMIRLLGPFRDERLRRRAGVKHWGATVAVTFRSAVPDGEQVASLDGI